MPDYKFTTNWFGGHSGEWRKQLHAIYSRRVQTNGVFRCLEVGSFEGRSALWLLNNYSDAWLECIDPHTNDVVRERFLENTLELRQTGRLIYDQGYSAVKLAARLAVRREYDFIYIDGCHEGATVLSDAVMGFNLLSVGGKMCFDDYKWKRSYRHRPPKPAIDAFLDLYGPYLKVLYKHWQVWVIKTAPAITT